MARFIVFVRFVLCGGGVGLASSAAVPLLAQQIPWTLANALITVVATILATELHARFTFGPTRRCGLRRHVASAGTAAGVYGATTAAMLTLQPAPGTLHEQAVYLTASALAGLGRFMVLRLYVFSAVEKHVAPAVGDCKDFKNGPDADHAARSTRAHSPRWCAALHRQSGRSYARGRLGPRLRAATGPGRWGGSTTRGFHGGRGRAEGSEPARGVAKHANAVAEATSGKPALRPPVGGSGRGSMHRPGEEFR